MGEQPRHAAGAAGKWRAGPTRRRPRLPAVLTSRVTNTLWFRYASSATRRLMVTEQPAARACRNSRAWSPSVDVGGRAPAFRRDTRRTSPRPAPRPRSQFVPWSEFLPWGSAAPRSHTWTPTPSTDRTEDREGQVHAAAAEAGGGVAGTSRAVRGPPRARPPAQEQRRRGSNVLASARLSPKRGGVTAFANQRGSGARGLRSRGWGVPLSPAATPLGGARGPPGVPGSDRTPCLCCRWDG